MSDWVDVMLLVNSKNPGGKPHFKRKTKHPVLDMLVWDAWGASEKIHTADNWIYSLELQETPGQEIEGNEITRKFREQPISQRETNI